MISPWWTPPDDFPTVISPDFESLLQRMKRLVFAKPLTSRLTPGSNDYTNPNTNPTRPSRHLTWHGREHRGENYRGKSPGGTTGGVHQGKSPASSLDTLFRLAQALYAVVHCAECIPLYMVTLWSTFPTLWKRRAIPFLWLTSVWMKRAILSSNIVNSKQSFLFYSHIYIWHHLQ